MTDVGHGLSLLLPGGEKGGMRGFPRLIDRNPLTPTLSPMGRGSAPSLWSYLRSQQMRL
jgi:hypothetical protein